MNTVLVIGASRGIVMEFVRQYRKAGVMARSGATTPPTPEEFDHVLHTNVLGAMQAIPQVAPLVEEAGGCFAFISSAMAQIGGVASSYGWTYRISKAALNMAVASAQHDYPKAILVAMLSGWVQNDMGGEGGALTAEQSVSSMRKALAGLGPQHKDAFLDHDGSHFSTW